jgi:hypothetical protein
MDENPGINDFHNIECLVKDFPDPYDYIVGFVCLTQTDQRRSSNSAISNSHATK